MSKMWMYSSQHAHVECTQTYCYSWLLLEVLLTHNKKTLNTIPGIWLVDTLQCVTCNKMYRWKKCREEQNYDRILGFYLSIFEFQSTIANTWNYMFVVRIYKCCMTKKEYQNLFFSVMVRYTKTTNLFLLYHKKPTKGGEEYKRFRKM